MSQDRFRSRKWGVLVLIGLGLAGCRAPMSSEPLAPISKSIDAGIELDQLAWADFEAAQTEFQSAWQELENLKLEAQRAKIRVEAVRQQLQDLESARASEVEAFKEKAAALEASLSKKQYR